MKRLKLIWPTFLSLIFLNASLRMPVDLPLYPTNPIDILFYLIPVVILILAVPVLAAMFTIALRSSRCT